MELYLDTANVKEVERLARIFPIAGVTTNPSIVAAGKESIWDVLPRLQKAIGPEGILFAQTMSRDAQGMVEEARRLSNAVPGIVVKIPVTSEGLAAIKLLKKKAFRHSALLFTARHKGCLPPWLARNMWRLTSTVSTLRAETVFAPCKNCKACWNNMPRKAKCWQPASKPSPGARLPAGRLRSDHASPGCSATNARYPCGRVSNREV
jgi:hypothetical protein